MRLGARLATTKLTLRLRSSTTSWTTDSEYLFWAELFFHGARADAIQGLRGWNGRGIASTNARRLIPSILACPSLQLTLQWIAL
jgi:hypothetical protein